MSSRCLLLVVWSILVVGSVQGQGTLCEGGLGENIFEEGDFGTGTSNLLFPDPAIAPGYIYTTAPPPGDGFYTITNNTNVWSNLWVSWLRIGDNSPDPNGYMMVVNASFSPGVFFEQTVDGLCENTTYEFSADIINMIRAGEPGHIKPNVSFILDGTTQFTTGEIPQTSNWITYGFTFDTPPGVSEVTLRISNNAPGGIGNDLALDNISFRTCGANAFINTDQNIFLCADANDPAPITADVDLNEVVIQWQQSLDGGNTWNDLAGEDSAVYLHDEFSAGVYWYRYLSASSLANLTTLKCRVVSDVVKIEVLPLEFSVSETICEGNAYFLGTDSLTESGFYTADLISSIGCDSIVSLDLTILENTLQFDFDSEAPSCPGRSDGRIEIGTVTNGGSPFTYFLNGELSGSPSFLDLPGGEYEIKVVDQFNCSSSTTVDLVNKDLFVIDAGSDFNLRFGQRSGPIQVQSLQELARVEWTPADFLTCTDCPTVFIDGAQNQTYFIEAVNEKGCFAFDTLNVTVDTELLDIYVPNAFSPNFDGTNDYFSLYAFEQTVRNIKSMRVFNRWGALIFEAQNILANEELTGWDGRLKGELVQNGVYTYLFELELIDGRTILRSGTITVLR